MTDQITESDTTHRSEIYKFHTKLAEMGEHLADITTATLRQSKFTEEDVEFSCLIWDCGDELAGVGEFLIEAAKTISENISGEIPEVIEIADSDEDTLVNNEISITVLSQSFWDSAKRSVQKVQDCAKHTVQSVQVSTNNTVPSVQVSANNTVPSVQVFANNTWHVVSDTMSVNPQLVQTLPSGKKCTVHVCDFFFYLHF